MGRGKRRADLSYIVYVAIGTLCPFQQDIRSLFKLTGTEMTYQLLAFLLQDTGYYLHSSFL